MEPEFWDGERAREAPVDPYHCIWCKCETDPEARTLLETGETICDNCRGDAREWGRIKKIELYVWRGLEPAVQRVILDHWDAAADDLDDLYEDHEDLFALPTVKSNADAYETTHDP